MVITVLPPDPITAIGCPLRRGFDCCSTEAKKACPHLIFVVGDNTKYTHTCTELGKIYTGFTPHVEIYSVDEAFLDITGTHRLFEGIEAMGKTLKGLIRERFGINCTIGVGPNIIMYLLLL